MTEFLAVLKDVWIYYLVYTVCFLISVEFIKHYYESKIRDRELEFSEKFVPEYNELAGKYNDLLDAHNLLGAKWNELIKWYTVAWNKSQHELLLQVYNVPNRNKMKIFCQVLYADNTMVYLTNNIDLKTGRKSGQISNKGFKN